MTTESNQQPLRGCDESTRRLASDLAFCICGNPPQSDPEELATIITQALLGSNYYLPLPPEPEDFCASVGDCSRCPCPEICTCSHHAPLDKTECNGAVRLNKAKELLRQFSASPQTVADWMATASALIDLCAPISEREGVGGGDEPVVAPETCTIHGLPIIATDETGWKYCEHCS